MSALFMSLVSHILEFITLTFGYVSILLSNGWFEDNLSDNEFAMVIAIVTVLYVKAVESIMY